MSPDAGKRRWLRWNRGRQGTGYDKLLLLENRFLLPFDCYLLRYPDGCSVPPHRDPVRAGRHFRLNIVVKRSPAGGAFICEQPIYQSARLNLFRSDLSTHAVSRVEGGSRYVLSVGWLLPPRAGQFKVAAASACGSRAGTGCASVHCRTRGWQTPAT